jgi:23S rRNA (adenine-N6)-dimethyltransferase
MKRLDSYSQHFLRSPRLVAELIGHSNIRPRDLVLDIGAGSGVISAVLASRAGRVIALETEPSALATLRRNMAPFDNVKVINGSILSYTLPTEPYKVFANIPFHLSSPIVHLLTESPNSPKAIYLIVQKQFGLKLLADDRHFTSQLGASLAPWWSVRIRKPLRKTDFTPPPAVDTVLLEMKRREEPLLPASEAERYRELIHNSFDKPAYFAKLPRVKVGINPERTPSQLTGEQWIALYGLS